MQEGQRTSDLCFDCQAPATITLVCPSCAQARVALHGDQFLTELITEVMAQNPDRQISVRQETATPARKKTNDVSSAQLWAGDAS